MWKKFKTFIKKNRTLSSFMLPIYRSIKSNKSGALYDKFFSSVVGGSLIVKINNIPGEYEIDVRSHILKRIMLTKEYEPEIVEHIIKHVDKCKDAINVGANVGFITNLLANSLNSDCKVLAMEPTPNAYKFLERNIKCNGKEDQVIFFKGVAADKVDNYKVNVIDGNEEYSSLGALIYPSIKDKHFTSVEVRGETIDNLVDLYGLKPGIIVIDVEGAEYSVLKGSIDTLKRFKPVIVSEIDDGLLHEQKSDSKQILNLLEEIGFRVLDTKGAKISFPFVGNIIALPNLKL